MKSHAARALLLTGLLAVVLAGCVDDTTGPMPGNLSPVTYLSIQGDDLDTVSYRQVLHWWGSDRDGHVVGYLIRWDGGWTAPDTARRWEEDPSWIVTTATSDTFTLVTNGTYAERTFAVRALDDAGAADPTGRSQRFRLRNHRPKIEWSYTLPRPRTSLPAVAFAWVATDRDGDATIDLYRYWLTREEPAPASTDTFTTGATLVAVRPEEFASAGGPLAGTWTLHVLAVDDGGARSDPVNHTWSVEEPAGEYLLIDNVGDWVPGFRTEDTFYRAMMDSIVPGNYHIRDIQAEGNFRADVEIGPLFSLFRGVVWYGGLKNARNDDSLRVNLALADQGDGLREYLEGGGRLFLAAGAAVGDTAGLSERFWEDVLGINGFFRLNRRTDIGLPGRSTIQARTRPGEVDSLQTTSSMLGTDFLILDSDVEALFHVPPGFIAGIYPDPSDVIDPDQSEVDAMLGVLSRRQGTMALTTFIPSRANGLQNRDRVMVALLRRVLLER